MANDYMGKHNQQHLVPKNPYFNQLIILRDMNSFNAIEFLMHYAHICNQVLPFLQLKLNVFDEKFT